MERTTEPLISIIIPAYNCEKYIEKCINSILLQTYQNFEIIIINDGSQDHTLEKINNYLNKNKIKLISIENNGVSNARNLGIENSKGDYICFIDADDWIEKDYLEYFVKNTTLEYNLLIQYSLQKNIFFSNPSHPSVTLSINYDIEDLFLKFNIIKYGHPFCKFYSRKIIKDNNLLFDKGLTMAEDLIFFLIYIKHIDYITFLPEMKYHYEYVNNSAHTKKHEFDSYYHLFILFCKNISFFERNNKIGLLAEKYKIDFFECAIDSLYFNQISFLERIKKIKKLRKLNFKYKYIKLSLNREIIFFLIKTPYILDFYQNLKHFFINKLRNQ